MDVELINRKIKFCDTKQTSTCYTLVYFEHCKGLNTKQVKEVYNSREFSICKELYKKWMLTN